MKRKEIFEKSSNMGKIWQKNEEKPSSTCLKLIFRLISGNHLVTSYVVFCNLIFKQKKMYAEVDQIKLRANFTLVMNLVKFVKTRLKESRLISWNKLLLYYVQLPFKSNI